MNLDFMSYMVHILQQEIHLPVFSSFSLSIYLSHSDLTFSHTHTNTH